MKRNVAKLVGAACGVATAVAAQGGVVTVDTATVGGNDGSIIYTPTGQGSLTADAYTMSTSGATGRIIGIAGSTGSRSADAFVMAFRLPTLPSGDVVNAASMSVFLQTLTGVPTFNGDLWGLGFRSSNAINVGTVNASGVSTSTGDLNDATGTGNPGTALAVQFSDSTDTGAASGTVAREKIMDNMITPSSPVSIASTNGDTVNAISTSSSAAAAAALTSYIQEVYADGAAATAGATGGYSTGLVFLRLSPDAPINVTGSLLRYNMWTNNDGTSGVTAEGSDFAPQLSIDFEPADSAPEPTTAALAFAGGVMAFGRRRRRNAATY